jgi:ferric-dicitrate binding protein FerR (iron transport regulator)
VKDYYHFTVNDFVMDEYFRQWVWNPNEESNRFWRSWIAKHPDKNTDIEEAISLLKKLNFPEHTLSDKEIVTLWDNIKNSTDSIKGSHNKPPANRWWLGVAAGLFVIMISYVINSKTDQTIRYKTAYGETRTLTLPDSSTVILNANSTLFFNRNWNENTIRQVWLDGEAFFEVVHTHNHQPFQVKVGEGVAVEVLGTSFNVYHRKADTKVVLNTGKITLTYPVAKTEKKLEMKPGELVEYKQDRITKRDVNPDIYAAWTENKIILNQTSLLEMIQMAKDNYGIEIHVASEKMLSQTVSGSMPVGDADSFANQIAMVFQLKIVRANNKILLEE